MVIDIKCSDCNKLLTDLEMNKSEKYHVLLCTLCMNGQFIKRVENRECDLVR